MRVINDRFMYDLKQGKLSDILKLVKADDTLCLEIRDNYINIYYRGGSILNIAQKGNAYIFKFDDRYCVNNGGVFETFDVKKLDTVEDYIKYLPLLKREMDNWFSQNSKLEREFQQIILRDNNSTSIANDTDYYISDIEYANTENGSRFDMTGIKWPSTATARKKRCASLAIFEVKYGDNAMTGCAGIVKHFKDIESFIDSFKDSNKISKLYSEVESQFNQKVELGLIKDISDKISVDASGKAEFIIVCANHKPAKSAMKRELVEALKIYPDIIQKIDVKIATASLMGYGLYCEKMVDISEYLSEVIL